MSWGRSGQVGRLYMTPAVASVVEHSQTDHTAELLLQRVKGILSQYFYQLSSLYKVKSQEKQFLFISQEIFSHSLMITTGWNADYLCKSRGSFSCESPEIPYF